MKIKNFKLKIKNEAAVQVVFIFTFYFLLFNCVAQQMPYYTQYMPNNIMLNPAVVGTKRLADVRMNYRAQWVGLDGAPVTTGISANSRFFNGTMGGGIAYFSDRTGPTRRSDFSLAYSYHVHFDDVELSLGLAGRRMSYLVNGTQLHMQVPLDNTINLSASQKKGVFDANAGLFLYNDRFHIGLSVLNLAQPAINYFPSTDTVHRTNIQMMPHFYGNFGFNWSGQPAWVWENSLQVVYAAANPITVDYNLRLHYLQSIFGGISIRLRDAIALQAGVTFMNDFHISYSYDFITSSLHSSQAGSHEIMIIWSSDLYKKKKFGHDTTRFKRQRYGYLF